MLQYGARTATACMGRNYILSKSTEASSSAGHVVLADLVKMDSQDTGLTMTCGLWAWALIEHSKDALAMFWHDETRQRLKECATPA